MKIVLNKSFGGFGLSKELYKELGVEWDGYGFLDNDDLGIKSDDSLAYRSDPRLIAAIEKIGEEKASGPLSKIQVIEVPDGIDWELDEYDGLESIHEVHRSW